MKELAKASPDWIMIGSDGKLAKVVRHGNGNSPDVTDQIVDFAHEYRVIVIAPKSPFKEGDDFLAVIKTIESIDARRGVTTVQGVLYSHLIEAEANRLLETIKRKANETRCSLTRLTLTLPKVFVSSSISTQCHHSHHWFCY